MNFAGLYREASFAISRTSNWRSRLSLLLATLRFHLGNKVNWRPLTARPVDVDIILGSKPVRLRLRPHAGDIFICYEVLAYNAYAIPSKYLQPSGVHTIVDCGANVGIASIFFSERYPDARIFAIEPEPGNFELLKRNAAPVHRIVPLQAAIVGSPRDRVCLSTDRPAWGNRVLCDSSNKNNVEVRALTIDELIKTQSIERIDILKIDIEGSEVELFQNPQFLSKVGLLIIELHDGYPVSDFQSAIAPFGFRVEGGGTCAGPLIARRVPPASTD